MLLEIAINNIALIARATLHFGHGFTVLTGETGAGKSMIIDAMNLLMGSRAERQLIRSGCDKAYAEAIFDLSDAPLAAQWMRENHFDCEDGQVFLSRELFAGGRSVSRLQGTAVPLSTVRALSALLIDMHGQHEHQALQAEAEQLKYLDAYGDETHRALVEEVRAAHRVLKEKAAQYRRMKREAQERDLEWKQLKEQDEELTKAELQPEEDEALRQEYTQIRSAVHLQQGLTAAQQALGDGTVGAAELIRQARQHLVPLSPLGAEYEQLEARAEALYYEADELNRSIQQRLLALDFNEDRRNAVEARLDLIRRLSRKYGPTVQDMMETHRQIRQKLEGARRLDGEKEKAYREASAALDEYRERSAALSGARKALAARFGEDMMRQLNLLNMEGTRFSVRFTECQTPSEDGMDQVCFLIQPNRGEEEKPLSQIASGGELSRIMLAIKAITAEHAGVATLIFDEIDAGISGRTAQTVAQKLWDIARYRQVLSITHLPQIAAMGDAQYRIEKNTREDRTFTQVTVLTPDDRVAEISRLISGADADSDSALAHAKHLLSAAEGYKASRALPQGNY